MYHTNLLLSGKVCVVKTNLKHCLIKLKPSTIKANGLGTLLYPAGCSFLGYLILDLVSHDVTTTSGTCRLTVEANMPSYYSVLALNCIFGLDKTLRAVTFQKFINVQTPHKMKGLVLTISIGLLIKCQQDGGPRLA